MDELPPSLFEEAPWRGLGEEFLHWGRQKILSEGLRMRASLFVGAPLLYGEPSWGVFICLWL
jgi:hypothetical protein